MTTAAEVRKHINELIEKKGLTLNSISLTLRPNSPAFMHKFLRYNTPVRLPEKERKILAQILEVPEQELTDIDLSTNNLPLHSDGISVLIDQATKFISNLRKKNIDTISIDMLDAVACCGTGIENLNENVNGKWLMPLIDFRQITMSAPENIKMIKVKGDSMEPTLKEGDWVLVDISRISPDSDGLFLLRLAGGLAVKRVQCGLGNDISVLSDNKKYPPLPATLEEIPIVGKVIYTLAAEKVG